MADPTITVKIRTQGAEEARRQAKAIKRDFEAMRVAANQATAGFKGFSTVAKDIQSVFRQVNQSVSQLRSLTKEMRQLAEATRKADVAAAGIAVKMNRQDIAAQKLAMANQRLGLEFQKLALQQEKAALQAKRVQQADERLRIQVERIIIAQERARQSAERVRQADVRNAHQAERLTIAKERLRQSEERLTLAKERAASRSGLLSNQLQSLRHSVLNTSAAVQTLAGAFAFREITHAIAELEAAQAQVLAISGNIALATERMGFLTDTANELGFAIAGLARPYARYMAAGRDTTLTTEELESSFTNIVSAIRAVGGNTHDVTGAIRAFEQILNKNAIRAEEVNLQLGDRMPGALSALRRVVEQAGGDFERMYEQGEIGLEFFTAFSEELLNTVGGMAAAEAASGLLMAALGRLGNALQQAAGDIGEGGFTDALKSSIDTITSFLSSDQGVATLRAIGGAVQALVQNFDSLVVAVSAFVALRLVAYLAGVVTAMRSAQTAAMGLNAVLASHPLGAAAVAAGALALAYEEVFGRMTAAERAQESVNQALQSSRGLLGQNITDVQELAEAYSALTAEQLRFTNVRLDTAIADQEQAIRDLTAAAREAVEEEAGGRLLNSFDIIGSGGGGLGADLFLGSLGMARDQAEEFADAINKIFDEVVDSQAELEGYLDTIIRISDASGNTDLIELVSAIVSVTSASGDGRDSIIDLVGALDRMKREQGIVRDRLSISSRAFDTFSDAVDQAVDFVRQFISVTARINAGGPITEQLEQVNAQINALRSGGLSALEDVREGFDAAGYALEEFQATTGNAEATMDDYNEALGKGTVEATRARDAGLELAKAERILQREEDELRESMRGGNRELENRTDKIEEALAGYRRSIQQTGDLIAAWDRGGAAVHDLRMEQERLNEAQRLGVDATSDLGREFLAAAEKAQALEDIENKLAEASENLREKTEESARTIKEKYEEAFQAQVEAAERAGKEVSDIVTDGLREAFDGTEDAWARMWDRMKDYAIDQIFQVIQQSYIQPIIQPIVNGAFGVGGGPGQPAAAGGGFSGGGGLGFDPASIGSGINDFFTIEAPFNPFGVGGTASDAAFQTSIANSGGVGSPLPAGATTGGGAPSINLLGPLSYGANAAFSFADGNPIAGGANVAAAIMSAIPGPTQIAAPFVALGGQILGSIIGTNSDRPNASARAALGGRPADAGVFDVFSEGETTPRRAIDMTAALQQQLQAMGDALGLAEGALNDMAVKVFDGADSLDVSVSFLADEALRSRDALKALVPGATEIRLEGIGEDPNVGGETRAFLESSGIAAAGSFGNVTVERDGAREDAEGAALFVAQAFIAGLKDSSPLITDAVVQLAQEADSAGALDQLIGRVLAFDETIKQLTETLDEAYQPLTPFEAGLQAIGDRFDALREEAEVLGRPDDIPTLDRAERRARQEASDNFFDAIVRQNRDAQGLGFIDQLRDRRQSRDSDLQSAEAAFSGDRLVAAQNMINQNFELFAQDLVDQNQLVGEQFDLLINQFPALEGVVRPFSDALGEALGEAHDGVFLFRDGLLALDARMADISRTVNGEFIPGTTILKERFPEVAEAFENLAGQPADQVLDALGGMMSMLQGSGASIEEMNAILEAGVPIVQAVTRAEEERQQRFADGHEALKRLAFPEDFIAGTSILASEMPDAAQAFANLSAEIDAGTASYEDFEHALNVAAGNAELTAAALDMANGVFGETAEAVDDVAAAASRASEALRDARDALDVGLTERLEGQDAANALRLDQLGVGSLRGELSDISGAGSLGEAEDELEDFIDVLTRISGSAETVSAAGQIAFSTFDRVAQSLQAANDNARQFEEQVRDSFDSLAVSFESSVESALAGLDRETQRLLDALESDFSDRIRGLEQARASLVRSQQEAFGAASAASAFLNDLATVGTNPETQFDILRERFDESAAAASGGDPRAVQALLGDSRSFVDAVREFFPEGTPQFQEQLEAVRDAVGAAGTEARSDAQEFSARIRAVDQNIVRQTEIFRDEYAQIRRSYEEAAKKLQEDLSAKLTSLNQLFVQFSTSDQSQRERLIGAVLQVVNSNGTIEQRLRELEERLAA